MKIILIGLGLAAAGGVAYYIYKNKSAQALLPSAVQNAISNQTATQSQALPSSTPIPSASKQTFWKDKDGHIFEMTSEKRKWGYHIKIDGGSNGELELLKLRSDGIVIGADNNGSVFEFKNGKWNYVVKDNKSAAGDYLVKNGAPNIYQGMNGLGAYLLS